VKTPLACVIGSLEIYERAKDKLTAAQKDTLIETALKEAYRLDGFITNILEMAKLESGAMKVNKELCVMDFIMDDCLRALRGQLKKFKVTVTAIPDTFAVMTDPVLLMRAICILLENALKFCPPFCDISIEYEKQGDDVIIRVKDHGLGIPIHEMEEIFAKFSRFSRRDNQPAGTGLGLPICREIMRLLDGSVSVANRADGPGAVFTLRFKG
jgi:two-component system sensor histidine kinase KdpD